MREFITIVEEYVMEDQSIINEILLTIEKCQKHFGKEYLFYGNCGIFAICLSQWASQKFNLKTGLAAILPRYEDDPNPLPLSSIQLGRTLEHVFSVIVVDGQTLFFDGDGLASKQTIQNWIDQTPLDDDDDEKPEEIVLSMGGLSERDKMVVEEGTDHECDPSEFMEVLQ